jgi:drug/metabolite transporter (DMT)-like permease
VKVRPIAYATLALVAFAANSVLCRLALRGAGIDPATFSTIRLASGAAMLLLVMTLTRREPPKARGSWTSAAMLTIYAVPFSFAYVGLSTGTGALILFGAVQVTMLVAAVRAGERPRVLEWSGLSLALAGLVYLVLPGLASPPLWAAVLMGIAGCSWGIYSLRGQRTSDPLAETASNFARAVPFVLAVSLVTLPRFHMTPRAALFAVMSGALASGLGYVAWYAAVRGLTRTRAAVLQLAVPILAAGGGVIFLAEAISLRLVVSAILVLGGIALAILGRRAAWRIVNTRTGKSGVI